MMRFCSSTARWSLRRAVPVLLLALIGILLSSDSRTAEPMVEGPMTPEREAAALTFARRHHPELAELLGQLREMNPQGYESAMTELFRTSERLAKLQSRQPERYASELEIWQLDSRIRLLVARSAGDPQGAAQQVRSLVLKRNAVRSRQMEEERTHLQERLAKLDQSIANYRDNADKLATQEAERLLKSVSNRKMTPAKKPTSEATTPVGSKRSPASATP